MSSRANGPETAGQKPKKKEGGGVRRPLLYAFSVILLVIIVVTFVGSGAIAQGVGAANRAVFGVYDGEEIAFAPSNYFARQREIAGQQFAFTGREATAEDIRQIWLQAYNRTVFHTAVLIAARESGVTVSKERVDEALASWPEFMENGRFSPDLYNQASSQEVFALRNLLREDLIDTQFRQDMFAQQTASAEEQFFVDMASPMRSFKYVAFAYRSYPDEAVLEFAQENERLFRRANLSRITLRGTREEAEEIRSQIVDRTTSFESMAEAQSQDVYSDEGGDMGWVYLYELEPDFTEDEPLDTIFSLAPGEVSGVLEATFGFVIYRLDEGPQAPDLENEETLETIRNYILTFERGRVEDYMLERAAEFETEVAERGFDEAAAESGFAWGTTDAFPINYGNLSFLPQVRADETTGLSNAATRDEFFEEAFSIGGEELTAPIVLRDYVLVMQLNDERQPTEEEVAAARRGSASFVDNARAREVERVVFDTDLFENRFNQAYDRYVVGN